MTEDQIDFNLKQVTDDIFSLKVRKDELLSKLSQIKIKLIPTVSRQEYLRLTGQRNKAQSEIHEIDNRLRRLKIDRYELTRKKQEFVSSRVKESKMHLSNKLKGEIGLLRDRYLEFSSDTTRVSSMRSMAAQFVVDLETLLKMKM